MSTTCSRVATSTTTEVKAAGTAITTFSDVLTTLPDSFITTRITATTCFSISIGTDCSSTFTDVVVTQPGIETMVQVPLTIVADGSTTVTSTLFGSVCSTIPQSDNNPSTNPPVQPGSISSPATPSPRTPIISGPSATLIPIASSSATADVSQSTGTSEENSFALGPVIGGAVGGIVVIAALIWLGWKLFYKPTKAAKANKHDSFWEEKVEANNYPTSSCPSLPRNPFCEPRQPLAPSQSTAVNTGAEQQQRDEWHKPRRLPKKAEEKLTEKMDELLYKPAATGAMEAAAGAGGAYTSRYAPSSYPPPYDAHHPHFTGSTAAYSPSSRPTSTVGYPAQHPYANAGGVGSAGYNQQSQQWVSTPLPLHPDN